MSKFVLITGVAKEDITKIAEYIAVDNRNASIKIVDDFYKTFELLSNFPETGSIKMKSKIKQYAYIQWKRILQSYTEY